MDINLIKKICGVIPENFIKVVPGDSSYVFMDDPNFTAINLYDFFGRAATVNSFTECFYYVELGFEPVKTTIFDIAFSIISVSLFIFVVWFTLRKKYLLKVKDFFIKKIIKFNFQDIVGNKRFVLMVAISYLVTSYFFLYDYVRSKSLRIPKFIDEYGVTINWYVDENGDRSKIYLSGDANTAWSPQPISGATIKYELNGDAYIYAEELEQEDFINRFEYSWAKSLLVYHPEYCYYKSCIRFESVVNPLDAFTSWSFDQLLNNTKTNSDLVISSQKLPK